VCWTDCADTFVTISLNDDDEPSAPVVDAALAKNDTRAHRGGDDGPGAGVAAATGVCVLCACDWAATGGDAAATAAARATLNVMGRHVTGCSYSLPSGWHE
jgi:hypothetical protein